VAFGRRMLLAAVIGTSLALVAACGGNSAPVATGPAGTQGGALASSGGIPKSPAPQRASLSETGSTLLFPLFQAWAQAYHQQFRGSPCGQRRPAQVPG
jgi:phosphate transport system substrate-binding protein